ncbi:hypothetical protein [Leifsonia sp. NPDC058230]|uniref:hypothetical protein n=1 Tax=Leifsonia sp. NPDC058230 TaxID=3346391 RepID=UPI0036D9DFC8
MNVTDWLLDSDPAIRWQVMRDLLDAPGSDVEAERARVATDGWGARLLELQDARGQWDGGTYRPGWADDSKPFFDAWTATTFSLQQLRDFGLDPASPQARSAIARVRDNVRWEATGTLFFEGETEPCINGMALAIGAYFGENVDRIVERLVADELPDGGWNCWADYGATVSSFNTTIDVVEGLLAWEQAGGTSDAVAVARRRGEEYLLERGLFRRRSDGRVADPRFTLLSYPTRWYYDILRALEHFRASGDAPDLRCAEAVELLADKRHSDGWWPLENAHQGPTHFELDDGEGRPSRWATLRATRVLRWWEER